MYDNGFLKKGGVYIFQLMDFYSGIQFFTSFLKE